jgi:hypothetical protein
MPSAHVAACLHVPVRESPSTTPSSVKPGNVKQDGSEQELPALQILHPYVSASLHRHLVFELAPVHVLQSPSSAVPVHVVSSSVKNSE